MLDPARFVPAPGQGTLALEARAGDARAREAVAAILDADTSACLLAERALASALDASCHTPLGAHATPAGCGCLGLRAWVGLPDGSAWVADELLGGFYDPAALGAAHGRAHERGRRAGAAHRSPETRAFRRESPRFSQRAGVDGRGQCLKRGRVYLVGAGPGDPGLLTARALELIASADTILYDRLIPASALDGARADAELLFVGKQGGGESVPQEQTEELMIDRARAGCMVVRLKGGDPFVFGRGGEEALRLRAAGIPYEIVPGVTAGVAAAAYAGIPVTHRGLASAVALVTGHEDPEQGPGDRARLARARGVPGHARLLHGRPRAATHRTSLIDAGRSTRGARGDRRTRHAPRPAHARGHARHDRRGGHRRGCARAVDHRRRPRRRALRRALLAAARAAGRAVPSPSPARVLPPAAWRGAWSRSVRASCRRPRSAPWRCPGPRPISRRYDLALPDEPGRGGRAVRAPARRRPGRARAGRNARGGDRPGHRRCARRAWNRRGRPPRARGRRGTCGGARPAHTARCARADRPCE